MYNKNELWPVGQAVKTAASHAVNIGSIPVRVTRKASLHSLGMRLAFYCCREQTAFAGVFIDESIKIEDNKPIGLIFRAVGQRPAAG